MSGEASNPDEGDAQIERRLPAAQGGQLMNEGDRSILLQAWVDNRMERDRSLLSLSAGGVGLVVTLLAAGLVNTIWLKVLAALSMMAFAGSVASSLAVFRKNPEYLEGLLRGNTDSGGLERQDRWLENSFFLGVMALLGLGLGLML